LTRPHGTQQPQPVPALARILSTPTAAERPERCELCGEDLHEGHGHVADVDHRSLRCVCRACGILFSHPGAGARYRALPSRVLALGGDVVSEDGWERLQIPVGLAFFFLNSELERPVAMYPSPAGATESLLPSGEWESLLESAPELAELVPDVEALLVRSERGRFEAFIVPIDTCYRLVGTLKSSWRGFTGGPEARAAIEDCFTDLRRRAGRRETAGST
jgi:hypothetical protein